MSAYNLYITVNSRILPPKVKGEASLKLSCLPFTTK